MNTRISLNKTLTILALCCATSWGSAIAYAPETPQYSGINQVLFYESEYNNYFAGNGFLIEYKDKVYAVTVKHVLFEAKTPSLRSVFLRGKLNQWRIHPNKNDQKYIRLGRLLNADKNEKLDMKILSKDWLVFEVKKNKSNLAILKLRDSDLSPGEELTAYGCSYINQASCRQDEYKGKFIKMEKNNLRIAMPNLEMGKLRGLSGSPVLDKENRVVGIVSNVLKSESGDGFDFAPASLNYLRDVLNKQKG